ncbi:MAG: MGMT family protein [Desulfobacteraceae bacterium]
MIWSVHEKQPKVLRVLLSRPKITAEQRIEASFADSTALSCVEISEVAGQIGAFLQGTAIRFALDVVRLDLCSDFQQKVLRAEHGIPRGYVSTYQRIARYLHKPLAARAVGTALARNPFPIIIPCHRAIRTDRTLGGYQGGLKMKRALLEMEGVRFDDKGRITAENLFYKNRRRGPRPEGWGWAADGRFPENARHVPVVKMHGPVGGEIHSRKDFRYLEEGN